MHYLDGMDLKTLIKDTKGLQPARALGILERVGGALDAAHDLGVVHRDIKPANILIERDGEVFLSDFGIAKLDSAEAGLTRTNMFVGTYNYAAPEQFEADVKIDRRTDIYALGCTLFEMLTGRPPFVGGSDASVMRGHLIDPPPKLADVRDGLPASLDEVISKALAKSPDDRYGSCAALVVGMREALDIPAPVAGTPLPALGAIQGEAAAAAANGGASAQVDKDAATVVGKAKPGMEGAAEPPTAPVEPPTPTTPAAPKTPKTAKKKKGAVAKTAAKSGAAAAAIEGGEAAASAPTAANAEPPITADPVDLAASEPATEPAPPDTTPAEPGTATSPATPVVDDETDPLLAASRKPAAKGSGSSLPLPVPVLVGIGVVLLLVVVGVGALVLGGGDDKPATKAKSHKSDQSKNDDKGSDDKGDTTSSNEIKLGKTLDATSQVPFSIEVPDDWTDFDNDGFTIATSLDVDNVETITKGSWSDTLDQDRSKAMVAWNTGTLLSGTQQQAIDYWNDSGYEVDSSSFLLIRGKDGIRVKGRIPSADGKFYAYLVNVGVDRWLNTTLFVASEDAFDDDLIDEIADSLKFDRDNFDSVIAEKEKCCLTPAVSTTTATQ
jgi:hypothetical protein